MDEKRMLIIITRMYAEQGNPISDEFVNPNFFNQDSSKSHAVFPCPVTDQTERVVVVIHGYDGRFNDPENYSDNATCLIVKAIMDAVNSCSIDISKFTIGILFHPEPTWSNFRRNFPQMIKKKLNDDNISFVQEYSSAMPENGYKKVQDLAQAVQKSNFQEKFDDVWDFFVLKPPIEISEAIRRLSILKHRIAHLFLPIDIDLQGLREVREPKRRREYASEIIEDYRTHGAHLLLQLLADLQFLMIRQGEIQFATSQAGDRVYTSMNDDSLPDRKCVKEVLKEAGVKFPSDLKQKCAFKNDWSFNPDADIARFLCALNEAVKKGSPDDFLKIVDNGVNGFNGRSFHQWFVQLMDALDNALDKLRDEIEQTQR